MFAHGLDEAQDIAQGMLAVRIRRHHAGKIRPEVQRGIQAGLERAPLALIDRMHGNLGAQRAALVKNMRERLLAAVVHQQHVELLFLEFARELNQPLIRLVGGNEHHRAKRILLLHSDSSLLLLLCPVSLGRHAISIAPDRPKVNRELFSLHGFSLCAKIEISFYIHTRPF